MGDEYASIFEAHAMMVSDPSFAGKVVQKIESEQVNAEWALAEVQEELQARFKSFDDEYLREREADVKDVADRVQTNLQGIAHHDLSEIKHDVIILADDLTPSDTIHFNRRPIVGFATEAGGRTSHTSIIAKSLIREIKEELDSEGLEYNPKLKIGIMVEVPSAAVIADILAQEADFFAIGTNDLIQYSLAIDRSNENVSYLYEPLHPALRRLIKGIIDAGKAAGIPVSMCGEMASDPIYAVVLIGLGLEIFSMNPSSIPIIKNIARSVRYRDCRRIAEMALQKKTAQEIEEFVIESVATRLPEGLINKSV